MTEGNNGRKETLWKALIWSCSVLVTINISMVGYVATHLVDMEIRIARIESTRFTNGDAAAFQSQFTDMERRIARLPKEIPPPWLKEYVFENRTRLKDLEKWVHKNGR